MYCILQDLFVHILTYTCQWCLLLLKQDLSSYVAKSIKEIDRVMDTGDKNRSVG